MFAYFVVDVGDVGEVAAPRSLDVMLLDVEVLVVARAENALRMWILNDGLSYSETIEWRPAAPLFLIPAFSRANRKTAKTEVWSRRGSMCHLGAYSSRKFLPSQPGHEDSPALPGRAKEIVPSLAPSEHSLNALGRQGSEHSNVQSIVIFSGLSLHCAEVRAKPRRRK